MDSKSSALQTIVRLMRKKAAAHYMKRLRPKKDEPKRSVKEIVSETVAAGDEGPTGESK